MATHKCRHRRCKDASGITTNGNKKYFFFPKISSETTLHYKEFIAENQYQLTIHNYVIHFFFLLNTIFRCNFSMLTTILPFHDSSKSSDPFRPPFQHMKNRVNGSSETQCVVRAPVATSTFDVSPLELSRNITTLLVAHDT